MASRLPSGALTGTQNSIDGQLDFSGGVDSSRHPRLLAEDRIAWAGNARLRGGYPKPRPGYRFRAFTGDSEVLAAMHAGRFQGAHVYRPDTGSDEIILAVSGLLYRIEPKNSGEFFVTQATDLQLFPNADRVFFEQAEQFLIAQDGLNRPIIYANGRAFRSEGSQVPVGTAMAYGNGRLWVANHTQYVAGDIVNGPTGTETYDFRDAVLYFTENTYLNGGGRFQVPAGSGAITALHFMANLDSALGTGEMLIFTDDMVFASSLPVSREEWQNLEYPVQRVAMVDYGTFGERSVANVNGDVFYRSRDGLRSLVAAVRDFGTWGNRPISQEVHRAFDRDAALALRFGSLIHWDNRLLATCSPYFHPQHGIVHRGIVSFDFDPLSSFRSVSHPSFDGVWSGLTVLQLLSASVRSRQCAFALTVEGDEIGLWELDTEATADWIGGESRPISWFVESKAYNFGSPFERKRLAGLEVFLHDLSGRADLSVCYRPDGQRQWADWGNWAEEAEIGLCKVTNDCLGLIAATPGYRTRRQLKNPPPAENTTVPCSYAELGYEFQVRVDVTGAATLGQLRLTRSESTEPAMQGQPENPPIATEDRACEKPVFLELN